MPSKNDSEAGNVPPRNRRPRVLVTHGGPPEGAGEAKGRVRVPYKQFLLVYSGKATAKDIVRLAIRGKVCLDGVGVDNVVGGGSGGVIVGCCY